MMRKINLILHCPISHYVSTKFISRRGWTLQGDGHENPSGQIGILSHCFQLWDTYRRPPLYTIIEQERTNQFIRTFLNKFNEGHYADLGLICQLHQHHDWLSRGFSHGDAYLKGIADYDVDLAFKAMKHQQIKIIWFKDCKNLGISQRLSQNLIKNMSMHMMIGL